MPRTSPDSGLWPPLYKHAHICLNLITSPPAAAVLFSSPMPMSSYTAGGRPACDNTQTPPVSGHPVYIQETLKSNRLPSPAAAAAAASPSRSHQPHPSRSTRPSIPSLDPQRPCTHPAAPPIWCPLLLLASSSFTSERRAVIVATTTPVTPSHPLLPPQAQAVTREASASTRESRGICIDTRGRDHQGKQFSIRPC